MAWSDEIQRVVMFGGDSGSGADDHRLWAFDPEAASWEVLAESDDGPHERWFHLMTQDPGTGRVVVIGGTGSIVTPIQGGAMRRLGPLDEVWAWSESQGWLASNGAPTQLTSISGAGDPVAGTILVYDGHAVMSYEVSTDSWEPVATREEADDE